MGVVKYAAKLVFGTVAAVLFLAVTLAMSIGPAVAYFVFGWKVAIGWFLVASGVDALITMFARFAKVANENISE